MSPDEIARFHETLSELNVLWSERLGERGVTCKVRRLKSVWGTCHCRRRYITFNLELARAPRELVEYVVVHEYTHFAVPNHGAAFYALMDARLPGWKDLRRRLNRREWGRRGVDLGGEGVV